MSEKIITISDPEQLSGLFGHLDENINRIQSEYNVSVVSRGDMIKIIGSENDAEEAAKAIDALIRINSSGQDLTEQTVRYVTSMVADGAEQQLSELSGDGVCVTSSGKIVRPRTVGQKKYIDSIRDYTIGTWKR